MHFSRFYLFVILQVLVHLNVSSQNWNLIYSKELDAEYLMFEGKYEKAAEKYKEVQKLIPQSFNITFKIGYSYIQTDDKKHLAIEFFEKAATSVSADFDSRAIKEVNAPPETFYFLGKAYQINGRFNDAIVAFKKYKDFIKPSHQSWDMVEQQILSCTIAPNQYNSPVPYRISNLGNPFNDEKSNFNAVFSADGQTMAYTSNSNLGYDIFISYKKGNEWDKPKKITSQLNENFFATASLSPDGTELYVVDIFSVDQSVYVSYYAKKSWSKAKKLPKPISSKFSETHASLSADGSTIYFTSNRPGGFGGLDIYKSTRDSKGKWGNPVNLGPTINTKLDEEFPFETVDGKYLFFSSQGHSSMGGFDVFYVDAKTLDEPKNVGYPINNSDDNFFFPIDRFTGYMALYNDKSLGQRDIFRFKLLPWVNLVADLEFDGKPQEKPNEINIHILDIEDNESLLDERTRLSNAEISKKLKPGKYQLTITGDGLERFTNDFVIPEEYEKPDFKISALLKPIPTDVPVLAAITEEIEEIKAEPATSEEIIEQVTEPVIIEETIETVAAVETPIVEEVFAETIIQENVTAKAKEKEEEKNQEASSMPIVQPITKTVSKTKTIGKAAPAPSIASNFYTVQIMALRNPVEVNYFSNIDNVTITKGQDDLYRYTVGLFNSINEAKVLQKELHEKGYHETFIRKIQVNAGYTIQIMALAVPKEVSFFKDFNNISVTKGPDELHRYTVGSYADPEEAKNELIKIVAMGYRDAFIRVLSSEF